jgi:dinuclear metal center YbgI/SA1388 family protein
MKLKELTSYLETEIPLSFQESYDNSGLQVGDPEMDINSALVTLDVTEDVLAEAAVKGCDVIISHHPVIFHGLKKLTGKTATERIVLKAVKQGTAIYSAHTNLDVIAGGVSRKMAEKLKLHNVRVLSPLSEKLIKLVTFVPESHIEKVKEALFNAGAGVIGNYDHCGFVTEGKGTFRGNETTSPYTGEKGKFHIQEEVRFETILFSHLKNKVVSALLSAHPYEEVAYDLYSLENNNIEMGLGCVGELAKPLPEKEFLKFVSEVFGAKGIRFSGSHGKEIKRIALCGGSGASLIGIAISAGADAFITADVKYHNFSDAEKAILLVDAGHFETEKFASEILNDLIIKKFPKFAVRFSETNTNPINYL